MWKLKWHGRSFLNNVLLKYVFIFSWIQNGFKTFRCVPSQNTKEEVPDLLIYFHQQEISSLLWRSFILFYCFIFRKVYSVNFTLWSGEHFSLKNFAMIANFVQCDSLLSVKLLRLMVCWKSGNDIVCQNIFLGWNQLETFAAVQKDFAFCGFHQNSNFKSAFSVFSSSASEKS